MKTSLTSFIAFLILISSCTSHADKNSQQFTLQGEMKGQDSGMVALTYLTDSTRIKDTAEIKNGEFLFTGRISEPTLAYLSDGNSSELAVFYLESQKMTISIVKGNSLGSIITGSKTQNEYDLLNKMEKPIRERLSELKKQGLNIGDSIKNAQDGSLKLLLREKREEISRLWSETRDKLYPIELRFVLENPKSFVTLNCLQRLASSDIISLDSLKSIFNGLDNSLRKSNSAKYITEDIRKKEEYIRKKENIRIGNQAPDFKATDLNEQTITLSQFKGKNVVLLDFWASWCVPCRQSIPHVRTIYNKYHSKGLEVIAVSIDENRKAWIEAVKQDSTEMWYHILVSEKWPKSPWTNDVIYQNYYYDGVPYQILIDKNGKILNRFGGYSTENEESLDRLLSQIFEN